MREDVISSACPSVMGNGRHRGAVEKTARTVFRLCAFFAVSAVGFITVYMVAGGMPAIGKVGLRELLFTTVWRPTAAEPRYGILAVILTSVVGTSLAVLLGMPVGILTAVFIAEFSGRRTAAALRAMVELLAGVPSVVYGLLGIFIVNPLIYKLELRLFADSPDHQFTGGANLLSAVMVLAVMILPTVISISENAIRSVANDIRSASLALGASRIQTVFKAVLPAARPGIETAVTLGVGRAMGEAMALTLISGGCVNMPLPFASVRFLTTAIVSEMGYSQGTHRQVLFTVGLVLFVFIMLINLALNGMMRREA